jgi:hypothetical protein
MRLTLMPCVLLGSALCALADPQDEIGKLERNLSESQRELRKLDVREDNARKALAGQSANSEEARLLSDAIERIRAGRMEIQAVARTLRDSLKQITEPVDKTAGTSGICPVHGTKMRKKKAPISYGLAEYQPELPKFPYARNYHPGGCVAIGREPAHAIIYVCPDCQRDEKQWRNKQDAKNR